MRKQVLFILSVDTEEEWDWAGPFPNESFSVQNVNEIPAFQLFCQELGIKPTYFVDYAVADNNAATDILKSLNHQQCEIGAHLHPWANPPFFNETTEFSSHVVNLPIEHVKLKLKALMTTISKNISVQAKSFRTGRWGINGNILKLLADENITVDSSIYPLYQNDFFSCENAPNQPYWPDHNNTNNIGKDKKILEIPVTVGFNRSNYKIAQWLHKLCEKRPFTWLRTNGLLWHSHLLRKLYLSPELCDADDMNTLIDIGLKKNQTVFHMYLHSSSLIENVTGLKIESNARENMCKRIKTVIDHINRKADVRFCTISQAKDNIGFPPARE
ncbi:MAG: WalW protein [Gammaproteobacteria bacterium]|nr:MAG: WalW protein [Gammaproteobacteria bacterium]